MATPCLLRAALDAEGRLICGFGAPATTEMPRTIFHCIVNEPGGGITHVSSSSGPSRRVLSSLMQSSTATPHSLTLLARTVHAMRQALLSAVAQLAPAASASVWEAEQGSPAVTWREDSAHTATAWLRAMQLGADPVVGGRLLNWQPAASMSPGLVRLLGSAAGVGAGGSSGLSLDPQAHRPRLPLLALWSAEGYLLLPAAGRAAPPSRHGSLALAWRAGAGTGRCWAVTVSQPSASQPFMTVTPLLPTTTSTTTSSGTSSGASEEHVTAMAIIKRLQVASSTTASATASASASASGREVGAVTEAVTYPCHAVPAHLEAGLFAAVGQAIRHVAAPAHLALPIYSTAPNGPAAASAATAEAAAASAAAAAEADASRWFANASADSIRLQHGADSSVASLASAASSYAAASASAYAYAAVSGTRTQWQQHSSSGTGSSGGDSDREYQAALASAYHSNRQALQLAADRALRRSAVILQRMAAV